ncbi:hypothetical protein OKZ58_002490 [Vibrio alginolyticus]|nr:hypothetical protein [Vibrio alginolyticus]
MEYCLYIQYISCVNCKDIDMSKEKQLFQSALDVIIDGVAVSSAGEGRQEAGVILLEGLLTKYGHLVDAEKQKAIRSIIGMAAEVDSSIFRL